MITVKPIRRDSNDNRRPATIEVDLPDSEPMLEAVRKAERSARWGGLARYVVVDGERRLRVKVSAADAGRLLRIVRESRQEGFRERVSGAIAAQIGGTNEVG